MNARFPPSARLLKQRQFKAVFADNRRRSDHIAVVLGSHGDGLRARLGITVSKKVSKRAVDRNRIKRQVRESFRQVQHKLQPLDYVVIARTTSAGADNGEIAHSLSKHWSRFYKKTHRSGA